MSIDFASMWSPAAAAPWTASPVVEQGAAVLFHPFAAPAHDVHSGPSAPVADHAPCIAEQARAGMLSSIEFDAAVDAGSGALKARH